MLHVGILPNHPAWGDLLANLAVVVVDEAHVYRGVFGSHVANVLRRLRRLASVYGTAPRFLLASATVANPVQLAEALSGLDDFALVDRDGSPQAERRIAMWNPPLLDEALGVRGSPLREASELLVALVRRGRAHDLLHEVAPGGRAHRPRRRRRACARRASPTLAERVAPYRAGYTPAQRRELERRLVDGDLLGVVATDALELGIDIGALDAAISRHLPRHGRLAAPAMGAGPGGAAAAWPSTWPARTRWTSSSAATRTSSSTGPWRRRSSTTSPRRSTSQHLLCAAHEGPLDDADAEFLGPRWRGYAELLESRGELRPAPRRVRAAPSRGLSRRRACRCARPRRDAFAIVEAESGEVMGTVEAARAFSTAHEGAIYLHLGRSYAVEGLDLEGRAAFVAPFSGDYYTQPKRESATDIERLLGRREALGVTLSFGTVAVTEQVIGYQRKRLVDHEVLDFNALDLPETTFSTQALWYELPDELIAGLPLDALLGSLHAAEHSQIAVLPLLAMCDRWDIGGLSTNFHPQTGRATIFIYDGHPGGVGISRRGFEEFERLVTDAHRLIAECRCRSGCPSCVQSPKCGNLNEPLSKAGALELMATMLGH